MEFILSAFADEAGSSLDEQIHALQEHHIPQIEIRGVEGKSVCDLPAAQVREIGRRLADAGIAVWSIGSPLGKIGVEDDFTPHMEQFYRTLEAARLLGAANIRLFSFYVHGDHTAGRDVAFERLAWFCDEAKGSGVTLCHENEKGIYGDIAEHCAEIHQTFPSLRGIFDPSNFIQCGQAVLPAWELLKEQIKYLHIKDCLPDGTVVPSGFGAGHIREITADFYERGGRVLSIEPHLADFPGFSFLEEGASDTKERPRAFSTPREAFDEAVRAIHAIIGEGSGLK